MNFITSCLRHAVWMLVFVIGTAASAQISPGKERRNRFTLNGCGFFVSQRIQRGKERGFKS